LPPKSMGLTLADLARRITGFSTPLFGVSWNPPAAERDTVRAFLTFLEDRRVLFNPDFLEVEWQVQDSVQQIRQQCTATIAKLHDQSRAIAPLRSVRAACRRFLDEPRLDYRHFANRGPRDTDRPSFFTALGEFRAAIGIHIANLALLYQIELEPELASIVPAEDKD